MRVTIVQGNMREQSNTAILVEHLQHVFKENEIDFVKYNLKEMRIEPCTACWQCQDNHNAFGCPKKDDVHKIYSSILESDLIILATPIYSWYCTPIMKSLIDRLVYGFNKYYGETYGGSIWEGKKLGLVVSCGYDLEAGAGVFEEGIKRYCTHSKLEFVGMTGVQDIDGKEYFTGEFAQNTIRTFVESIILQN